MSKGAHDIFALVINFLMVDWQLKHIMISLLKARILQDKFWQEVSWN
jgi:hypothetical protein